MTHRPTFVSKYSSQGFSQQLSKSTNKTCVPRNTFINGGNLQPAEFYTKDSCKLFQQLVTECTDQYRLYSLVHLLQQPVTEELMEKIEFNTVKIVKRPARDACLCMGELPAPPAPPAPAAPPAPPAPHFVFLITL